MGAATDVIAATGTKRGSSPTLALVAALVALLGGGALGSGISSGATGERLAALEARMEGVQKSLDELKAEIRKR